MLRLPLNPNGRHNSDVVKRYYTVRDVFLRDSEQWIIDFDELDEDDASLYEAPFHFLRNLQGDLADRERTKSRKKWWKFRRSGIEIRTLIKNKNRILATGLVTKHRIFRWIECPAIPDTRVIIIDSESDVMFGILSGRIHNLWTLANCQFHGVGNDPIYTPGDCFDTFPFPEDLTPNIPAVAYEVDPRAIAIAKSAARLNELRENWLNPADLVRREPEVVPGYPDRILPVNPEAERELKKRTLTNLYNARPTWLANAHKALDEAVAAAYGWPADLPDDEVLARLFTLNQERAAAQAKKK
ncbi:type II restriction/modification system DNA methylase subunit YeeA [Xanthobacter sp. SG618]|nr:type II restriction/modification system DNA methylase subunit YeeA [Xanthobacter sp. SG618]